MLRNSEQENASPNSTEITRRNMAARAIYGLVSLIGMALCAPVSMYVFARPKAENEKGWIDAGSLGNLPPGAPRSVTVPRVHIDGWKMRSGKDTVWVVRQPDGEVRAFSPLCTHLGCAYHPDKTKGNFLCPCHGSEFSFSGKVLAGPAPRPLDQYAVKIDGDRLWLSPSLIAGEAGRHA